jgi:hypothetical protein
MPKPAFAPCRNVLVEIDPHDPPTPTAREGICTMPYSHVMQAGTVLRNHFNCHFNIPLNPKNFNRPKTATELHELS